MTPTARGGRPVSQSCARDIAVDLIKFIDASPSPYHAAAQARRRLTEAGFAEIPLNGGWPSGAGRYVTGTPADWRRWHIEHLLFYGGGRHIDPMASPRGRRRKPHNGRPSSRWPVRW